MRAKPFSVWIRSQNGVETHISNHVSEAAAVRNAKECAPTPELGCFANPAQYVGESIVRGPGEDGRVILHRYQAKPVASRNGVRLRPVETTTIQPNTVH